jgi:hypothetical protein
MAEEQSESATTPDSDAAPEGAAGKSKSKRAGGEKPHRSHADRAMANIRAAKRGQREVSEPTERARILLAEANVLALLDVAEALGGSSLTPKPEKDGDPSGAD